MKKTVSIVLAFAMLLTLLPLSAMTVSAATNKINIQAVDVYVDAEPIVIESLEIGGLTAPEIGQTVGAWGNASWANFSINGVGANDDWVFGNVLFDGLYPLNADKQRLRDEKFIGKGTYYWCIDVGPAEGYVFADEMTITVSGVESDRIEIEDYGTGWFGIYVRYEVEEPAPAFLKGDVNFDGQVTAFDALMILQEANGIGTLTGDALAAADVNGDGPVTAFDALGALQLANSATQ